ncbi:MAG TPA: PD-(D/E)XK nuclease family protein [Candidatus Bathyarchaeia archaeon]|nr:PD-(D/E)XK nuclease family protein [Candidatus Bathyarchaeia archaeon]
MVSPFMEGLPVQYAWDSTSLGWLKECPRKYFYSMIEGWRPKHEAVNLKFGALYHAALELYDRSLSEGKDHDEAQIDAVAYCLTNTWEPANGDRPAGPWLSDHNTKTRETLVRSVVWYLEQFGARDPAKTIQLANGKPAVELTFKLELDFGPAAHVNYILCGHLDRLVGYAEGTYGMDRKTSSTTLSSNYFDQYDPDNQMSLYTLACKVIYATPVKGIIIDAAQIAVGFTRFSRGFTYRTDAQLDEWLDDSRYWFEMQRRFAEMNKWPMNDKSCHKYGGCHFRKVCSKSPEVRDIFLHTDFIKQPWNPLIPR